MQENNLYISDTNDIELFVSGESKIVFSNELTLNAKEGRINYQENATKLTLKSLKIDTVCQNEGGYSRKLYLEMYNESASTLKKEEKAFEAKLKELDVKYEKDSSSGETANFTIEYTAKDEKELLSYTMRILNVGSGINLKEEFASGTNVKITVNEYIELDRLLTEDGRFEYKFMLNEKYKDLSLTEIYEDESKYNIEENQLIYTGKDNTIKYSYKKPFEFNKISIITDFSKDTKITRTISLRARTIIAEKMHDKIKQSVANILIDGTTLNIYDKGAYRYYDIEFSSSSVKKINSITTSILEGESCLKVTKRVLPFLVSKLEDKIEINSICDIVDTWNNIELKYTFGKEAKLLKSEEEKVLMDENSFIINLNEVSEKIELKYKNFDKILFAKIILFIIIIIVAFLIIKNKISKKIKKIKEKSKIKKENKEAKKKEKAEKKKNSKEKNGKIKENSKQKEETNNNKGDAK